MAEQRLQGLPGFGTLLVERGVLKPGLTVDRARDMIWALCAQANYDALVVACGWTTTGYRDWLAHALAAVLLAED